MIAAAGRSCAFVTFGCKINLYDTQAIREAILELGYEEVDAAAEPDVLVVNACTVTAHAGGKSSAAVRRLARRHPHAAIIVTGCLTEDERGALAEVPGVFHVVGNEEKDQIPALLQGFARRPVGARKHHDLRRLRASRFEHRTRAFLKVQDGCDEFCSYCIIPHLRGPSRSRELADVIAEAQRMAGAGHRELVLTGIHLSRFGRDLAGPERLVDLLALLLQIPGVLRLRLSSIGEGAFTESFVRLFEATPALCRFFHIPLQSGSDAVLARMRRDYRVADYLDTVERVRAHLPGSQIATDLMVGFPGETEAEFEESLATCREVGFGRMHIFPYSPRPRTEAARLPSHLAPAEREARVARARAVEDEMARAARAEWLGRTVRVLVERHDDTRASGLSREGHTVEFEHGRARTPWNDEISVRIHAQRDGRLVGTALGTEEAR